MEVAMDKKGSLVKVIVSFIPPSLLAILILCDRVFLPEEATNTGLGNLPNLGRNIYLFVIVIHYFTVYLCTLTVLAKDAAQRLSRNNAAICGVLLAMLLSGGIAFPIYAAAAARKPMPEADVARISGFGGVMTVSAAVGLVKGIAVAVIIGLGFVAGLIAGIIIAACVVVATGLGYPYPKQNDEKAPTSSLEGSWLAAVLPLAITVLTVPVIWNEDRYYSVEFFLGLYYLFLPVFYLIPFLILGFDAERRLEGRKRILWVLFMALLPPAGCLAYKIASRKTAAEKL